MFCRNCGKEINETLNKCPFCGEPILKIKIKSYLLESILAAIVCNIIFGLIALYYSIKVKRALNMDMIEEAIKTSKSAKKWLIISAIAFFVELLLLIVSLFYSNV
ncbi:CD225/dispanin family protein [bacterium]|nr:CD225/dispanin family protein [bacterium]